MRASRRTVPHAIVRESADWNSILVNFSYAPNIVDLSSIKNLALSSVRLVRFCTTLLWFGAKIVRGARLIPQNHRDYYREISKLQSSGCAAICRALNITVSINGEFPPEKRMLIACNHPGLLDPWVVGTRLLVGFVAKIVGMFGESPMR